MKNITYKDLETCFPKIEIGNTDEQYLGVYSLYNKLVIDYLDKHLKLSDFDNHFKNDELNYIKVNDNDMDIYQYLSSGFLNYFYVRNNIHLERLDNDEYNFLINKLLNVDDSLDEKSELFIDKTIKKVLSESLDGEYEINYGPSNSKFYAPTNSLVIGFRYDEFNNEGVSDEVWDNNHEKQIDDIFQTFLDLEIQAETFKLMPVKIIQYNEYSVKKKVSSYIKMKS